MGNAFDPAPRNYPPFVSTTRRTRRGPRAAPSSNTSAEVEAWLIYEAPKLNDFLLLTEEFFWRIAATGAPLDRASLHVGTLHPQLAGYGWNWMSSDEILDEIIIDIRSRTQDSFRKNPLFLAFEKGKTVRASPGDPAARDRFPLFEELHEQGVTDYIARPIGRGGAYHNAATIGTFQKGGFTDSEVAQIQRLFDIFALHAERHIEAMVARNVVSAYLGAGPGQEVLEGAIHRGSGRSTRAVIWASDLRGFTERADRLAPEDTNAMLNFYFEAMSGAVLRHGGEVLKFIGDGLLAVFPVETSGEKDAAARSLTAAREAVEAVKTLNENPPEGLPQAALPLASGIGLHLGDVFFGNVGAPNRLDFTVIGRAVNEASRIEAMTKIIGRPVLVSEKVAALLQEDLEDMGAHELRGLSTAAHLFAI